MLKMMKNRYIISCILLILTVVTAKADSLFQYPIIPDSIQTLTGRCNYQARHFWDFCDLKRAFSSKSRMADEFKGWLEILQMADADTAVTSLKAFMGKLEKQPKDMLFLADVAEGELYSDTAKAWVDELYIPIAEAVAGNKRIDKASKARYDHQARILKNSLPGRRIPSIPYTRLDGTKGDVATDSAQVVVLFINDPECSDCFMARVRLNADVNTSQLIDEGVVKVISLSAVEPDEDWKKEAASYPSTWVVAANPDVDLTMDMRGGTPSFYILDRNHKIRFKHLTADQVLDIMRQLKKR